MNIFESLEELNISEECFNDIILMVEAMLSEDIESAISKYGESPSKRHELWDKVKKIKTKDKNLRVVNQFRKNRDQGEDIDTAMTNAKIKTGYDGSHEETKNSKGQDRTRARNVQHRGDHEYKSGFNHDLKPILNSIRKQVEKREKWN